MKLTEEQIETITKIVAEAFDVYDVASSRMQIVYGVVEEIAYYLETGNTWAQDESI